MRCIDLRLDRGRAKCGRSTSLAMNRLVSPTGSLVLLLILPLLSITLSDRAWAQGARRDATAALQQALAQAQLESRRLRSEKGQLEGEIETLNGELEDAERRRQELVAELRTLRGELAKSRSESQRMEQRVEVRNQTIDLARNRIKEANSRYSEAFGALRLCIREKSKEQQQLKSTQKELERCHQGNTTLYQANRELMQRYEEVADSDLPALFGESQVELENLLLDYEVRIKRARREAE